MTTEDLKMTTEGMGQGECYWKETILDWTEGRTQGNEGNIGRAINKKY